MRELRRAFMAIGYFTRIPIPRWEGWAPDELNRAARYFPLAGLIVGAVAACVAWLAAMVLPWPLAVLMSMAASLMLTGGFHEDGLADATDGFGGGWQRADVLRIMKDSRIGSFGAMALIMALLTKFVALDALGIAGPLLPCLALIAIHPLSRAAALWIMAVLPYVRDEDSRAKPVAQGIGTAEISIGLLTGVLPLACVAAVGPFDLRPWLAVLVATILTAWLCRRYFARRLEGYTGDCLGMAQQLCELAGYVALCVRWA
ncbi:adenosylcobinamide-GDP ribazoletransferase [Uliginosibacterium sp. sgz301328]|uniref:adenosylcobinamide-GDP ribazoletransferase n=1 Tax=Uliginosibacterium sp. sgz301328 TaxID=3243764 RepID=UPI00359E6656